MSTIPEEVKYDRIRFGKPEYMPHYRCICYTLLKNLCQREFGMENTFMMEKSELKETIFLTIKKFYNYKKASSDGSGRVTRAIPEIQKKILKNDSKVKYLIMDILVAINVCKMTELDFFEFDKEMIQKLNRVFEKRNREMIFKALDKLLNDLSKEMKASKQAASLAAC